MWLVVPLAIVGVARSVGQETNENRRSGNRPKEPSNRWGLGDRRPSTSLPNKR